LRILDTGISSLDVVAIGEGGALLGNLEDWEMFDWLEVVDMLSRSALVILPPGPDPLIVE